MNNNLINPKFKVLSGSMLKTIAVFSMLIDHIAAVLLQNNPMVLFSFHGHDMYLYTFMRNYIGRLAFPIYAFLIVEGVMHTHDRKKYCRGLLLFALLSEIPWNLEHANSVMYGSQNVFFTLFIGALGICMAEKYKDDLKKQAMWLVGLLVLTIPLSADYGIRGYAFIMALYFLRENWLFATIVGAGFFTWRAGMAFIPISLYNGERGYIRGWMKWFFYAFYPVHMLILWYLKCRYIGY